MRIHVPNFILTSVVCVCVALLPLVQGANKAEYYDLYNTLFEDETYPYNKNVRPVESDGTALSVSLEFSLLSLVDVNEKEQMLVTNARLEMYWQDNFLSWDPEDKAGIERIMVPQDYLWLPDVVLGNGVEPQRQLGFNELPVLVNHDGYVDWQPTVLLATSCSIDITYFPFDTQQCEIEFQTALSDHNQVQLVVNTENPVSTDSFSEDGQWKVERTSVTNIRDARQKNRLIFTITLTRRRTFYLIYIIVPIFFLSMTSSLIFALPPDEGEKTGTGITVVLAFAVYLTIVADLVPNTSLQVSILSVYLTFLLGMSDISLIVCVFILRVHFRDNSTRVGPKTRRLVSILRKMTFMEPLGGGGSPNVVTPIGSSDLEDIKHIKELPDVSQPEVENSFRQEDKMTWQAVAATYDWFCFLFFSCSTIVATIAYILALEIGSKTSGF